MEIILTHEQADFDALAAMLAAHLLADGSTPLLPNRLNRNLKKFINLYGSELPFIELRDLPHRSIRSITLVDTQSLVTIKGITRETRVHVIDHHLEKEDLPADWTRSIEKVGATTTLLVESLAERDLPLTTVQATLLLLGIYEDTGSLTYASTTLRDVKAVVYLLENGASLKIAAEYLNPALSTEQRSLADRLLKDVRALTVNGKHILFARADAREMNEEISSVAHKMRDLLDPDALFLLVRTSEGFRLIARSTTDEVKVGAILVPFGGGGHERAASALIQDASTTEEEAGRFADSLIAQLEAELHRQVVPSLTVKKIMSRRPILLTPETSLSEADTLMQRYGFEGFPVIAEGKVAGLLTRRTVDRAQQHKLKLNAGSLMEAGNHFLTPDQSFSEVQDLMAATGWGQIPVVDPARNEIVGIVTRTDLLKNLIGGEKSPARPNNYAKMLEKALPACRLALLKNVVAVATAEKMSIYIVGGFVRDLLLRRPSLDFDIVVEGDALKLGQTLKEKLGGKVTAHRRFGTAKWQIEPIHAALAEKLECPAGATGDLPASLDLISARTEFYERPTALPTVETSSIKQDLHRRDFTINTLALRLDGKHYGELQDHWGALEDLKKKRIKVLHSLSFVDDPTRMLRAARFEQRFGFQIESRTLQLIAEARDMLKQVSSDRVRHELDLVFKEEHPEKVLERLMALGLLQAIHSGLVWKENWQNALPNEETSWRNAPWNLAETQGNLPTRAFLAYLTWFGRLEIDAALAACRRLHFPTQFCDAVRDLFSLIDLTNLANTIPVSRFTEIVSKVPNGVIYAWARIAQNPALDARIQTYLTTWRKIEPHTDGEILKKLGVPPGPQYASILRELRAARLDGIINNDEQEEEYLQTLLQG